MALLVFLQFLYLTFPSTLPHLESETSVFSGAGTSEAQTGHTATQWWNWDFTPNLSSPLGHIAPQGESQVEAQSGQFLELVQDTGQPSEEPWQLFGKGRGPGKDSISGNRK